MVDASVARGLCFFIIIGIMASMFISNPIQMSSQWELIMTIVVPRPQPRAKKVCAASEGRRGERARGVPSRPAGPRPARGERPEPRRRRLARVRDPRPSARHGRRGPQPAARVLPPAAGDVAPPGRRLQLLPGAPATGVLQCRHSDQGQSGQ